MEQSPPSHRIRVLGDRLLFSAAHFITLADGTCEPLHGHNYRIAAEVSARLDEHALIVDFRELERRLAEILAELDHAVLLPAEHPSIRVAAGGVEVEVTAAGRRWVFPRSDCRLLPIRNTTAERLAQYLAERLRAALPAGGGRPLAVRVELEESPGRAAVCELGPGEE